MTHYLISEGRPTDYGGRTVRVDIVPDIERAERREWNAFEDGVLVRSRRQGLSAKTIARILDRTPSSVTARHLWLRRERRA